jgi:hypothetical protein
MDCSQKELIIGRFLRTDRDIEGVKKCLHIALLDWVSTIETVNIRTQSMAFAELTARFP